MLKTWGWKCSLPLPRLRTGKIYWDEYFNIISRQTIYTLSLMFVHGYCQPTLHIRSLHKTKSISSAIYPAHKAVIRMPTPPTYHRLLCSIFRIISQDTKTLDLCQGEWNYYYYVWVMAVALWNCHNDKHIEHNAMQIYITTRCQTSRTIHNIHARMLAQLLSACRCWIPGCVVCLLATSRRSVLNCLLGVKCN